MLVFNAKPIRSRVIKRYMQAIKVDRAVCFSCGNASKALKEEGIDTLDISCTGDLIANRWFTPAEVAERFKGYFDATSGHLPLHLMVAIANEFKKHLGELKESSYEVPTGSGETIICLKIAYPHINFIGVYNLGAPTEFSSEAPLNDVVKALFEVKGL